MHTDCMLDAASNFADLLQLISPKTSAKGGALGDDDDDTEEDGRNHIGRMESLYEVEAVTGKTGMEIGVNVSNIIIGGAIFTVPICMTSCGWFGLVAICFGTGVMLYTGVLLGNSLEVLEAEGCIEPSSGDIGERLMGPCARKVFTFFGVLECFLSSVFSIVFISSSVAPLLGLAIDAIIWPTVVLATALCIVPGRFFTLLSLVAIIFTALSASFVITSGLLLIPDVDTTQSFAGTMGVVQGTIIMLGPLAVAAGDHIVFAGIFHSARDAGSYTRGLQIGFAVFFCLTAVLSSVAYGTFGGAVQPVSLANIGMGRGDGYGQSSMPKWASPVCIIALAVRTVTVMPAFMKPVHTVLQEVLCSVTGGKLDLSIRPDEDSELGVLVHPRSGTLHPLRFGGRLCLWAVSFGLAGVVGVRLSHQLPQLEMLISGLIKSVNVVMVPCFGFWAICKDRPGLGVWQRPLAFLVGLCGVAWGIVGTYTAAASILLGSEA